MRLKTFFVAFMLLVVGMAQAQMMQLPVDKDVRIGKLSNGLTYYIRYNNWPEHRANFYIAQKVGSIQENENQRGLAHFLEHMAFNGSDNFKGNALIRYCESIGVQFGGDLNAYTSIDQTVYNIDNVPTKNINSIDSCILILRDWSTGLSLEQDEINKERGIIHEEWRLRTSASSRMFERNLPKLYPGSKYGLRYPIGLMSVVDNFKRQELVDYYKKWYHPSHQGLIIVGDIDVDHVEAQIKKLFSGIQNPKNEAPIVDEPVPDNAVPIVVIDKDKEQQNSIVELMVKTDAFPDSLKNDAQYLVLKYMLGAATAMLNNRFAEVAENADCPFVGAGAQYGNYIFAKTKDAFNISVAPKDITKTADALKAAYLEARRAAEFGFVATEYKRYQADYLSSLDKIYSNKDKRYSSQFYNEYKGKFLNNEPIPSIDDEYQLMKQIVPAIPVEAVNQLMKQLLPANDSNMVIVNFNNEKEGNVYPTETQLLGAVKDARAEKITAYVDKVKDEPLMTSMPKAGKIKKEEKNAKFGYTVLTLSNGAKVVFKQTDFKKDQVILQGRGEGGASFYGNNELANINAFDDVISASGLGNFSNTELIKALAGKIADASLTMNGKRMGISGSSTPKDIETLLQLVYLKMTAINKDQKSFDNLINNYKVSLKNRDLNPSTAFSDSVTATLYDHNPRVAPFKYDDIKNVSYDRILQMAKERTANAAGWTFTLIGNFDEAAIRPLIEKYIASLPSNKKIQTGKRLAFISAKNVDNTFVRKMETPKANALMYWTTTKMPWNLEHEIQADIAGQVLSMVYLKEIREEASAAYSCGAQGSFSYDEDENRAVLLGVCPMKPEKKDVAMKIMSNEVSKLAKTCDPSMLAKVKELMLKQADDALKQNNYWLGLINSNYRYGQDNLTDYKKLIEAQTPEKISLFVAEILKTANKLQVVMLPQK